MNTTEIPRNQEVDFKPEKVAITFTTSYPGWDKGNSSDIADTQKVRGDLALASFDLALGLGYHLLVSDFESSLDFQAELEKRGIKTFVRKGRDRAGGRRELFEASSQIPGIEVILRTEPEKISLIQSIPLIARPILEKKAEIVLPAREEDLFMSSYPDYMYKSETRANTRYNKLLHSLGLLPEGQDFDFFFGPTAFRNTPQNLSLFLERMQVKEPGTDFGVRAYVDPENYSNSLLFPIVKALFLGIDVATVSVPFVYPSSQKENELVNKKLFEEKRKSQRLGILDELILYLRYLKNPEDPKNVLMKTNNN